MNLPARHAVFFGSLLLAFSFTSQAFAQATYTATRDYSFAAFLAGSEVSTGRASTNSGVTAGFDITRHLHLFDPSLEFRIGEAPGTKVSEHTYQVGFKIERPIGRVHPYFDFLIGGGTIGYAHTSFTDNSVLPSFGGGVDFDLNSRWALKADYSRQSWKLGHATPLFNPSSVSVGIVYRFNFGK